MSFNVFTNNNTAFSISAGFQNYTSLISAYNDLGITANNTLNTLTSTQTSTQTSNWVVNSPTLLPVNYTCIAINDNGTIQVACTNTSIYLYKNGAWSSIYTISISGTNVGFNSICLSNNGVYITASSYSTGLYVSINSGASFIPVASIINPVEVYMSTDGKYQACYGYTILYTTSDNWISNSQTTVNGVFNSFCMNKNGSIQIAFSITPRRQLNMYFSNDSGNTFTIYILYPNYNTFTFSSCSCSEDGKVVTAIAYVKTALVLPDQNKGQIYVCTNFPTSTTFTPIGSSYSSFDLPISLSIATNQWCVIGGVVYQSLDTGNTWSAVLNLPSTNLVDTYWSQVVIILPLLLFITIKLIRMVPFII